MVREVEATEREAMVAAAMAMIAEAADHLAKGMALQVEAAELLATAKQGAASCPAPPATIKDKVATATGRSISPGRIRLATLDGRTLAKATGLKG